MASSSSSIIRCSPSSSPLIRTYDVFVSFRGEDTRLNFTDFLFRDLSRNGIEAFRDNTHLHKGQSIAPELLQAIQASRIFIVVFSKSYASSSWCLRELAHIYNCIQTSSRRVLPIFYDVDPSEVRRQSGSYETAFAEYEERFKEDKEMMEEVQLWREALTKVANLAGWDIQNKPQSGMIEEVIQIIKNILDCKFSCLPKDNLVGIEYPVEEILEKLCLESVNDVQVVGITGIGGIGKTTLARSLYERIIDKYSCGCFVEDVSKTYGDYRTTGIQKQLLSQCLNEKNLEISNASEGTYLAWTRLRHVKALIVLDNVDNLEQLQMFTGNRGTLLCDYLGGGSRIIIISRDKHILEAHGVNYVYQVQPLNHRDAVELFSRYAFKTDHIMSDYEMLTIDVLSYVQGHPLAIQVLGASLCNRNISQWKSVLARMKDNNSDDIMNVLQTSFDHLNDLDKEIFLDIACLFNYSPEQDLIEILKFRGFEPEIGLQNLIDKSLITIKYGLISMHHMLRDLGKCIVRRKSPKEPRKWSRLWDFQNLNKVMLEKMGSENLEAISCSNPHQIAIKVDALSKMSKLKFLALQCPDVNYYGSLHHLCNELGYLKWQNYHLKSLPPSFHPINLVELELVDSNIKQLWKDRKPLPNLRRLRLCYNKNLVKGPDLREALNLSYLDLSGCEKLRVLHPSIGHLRKLTLLNLSYCKSLIKLPHFRDNPILENICLEGCKQLKEINPSIGLLPKLTFFNLQGCENLVSLPNSILCLNSLEYLNLSCCSKLFGIQLLHEPRVEDDMKKLCISEGAICSHSTSSTVKRWFMSPLQLLDSKAQKDSLSCLPSLPALPCIRGLDLSFCNLDHIPDAIRNLHFLEILHLEGNNFSALPSLKELSKLNTLNLNYCRQLKYLSELPSQSHLSFERLRDIAMIPSFFQKHNPRLGLNMLGCTKLVEMECCRSRAFSWTIQLFQAHYQCKHLPCCDIFFPPCISSTIPGSEIPISWFNNQHDGMGNFITIDQSPLMQQANDQLEVIGLLCCLVFLPLYGSQRIFRKPPSETTLITVSMPNYLDIEGPVTNDHLWLFYIKSSQWGVSDCYAHSKLRIVIETYRDGIEVKKYGYRWVYEKDLKVSNFEKFFSN